MALNLFDPNYYRAANPSLGNLNDRDALLHFQNTGIQQGLPFSSFTDLNFYRASNSDLANFDNRQLYEHLSNFGVKEGRKFSPFVDLNYYLSQNGDLTVFNNDKELLFDHLRTYGVSEGRRFSPFVDIGFYRGANSSAANLDNRQAFQDLTLSGIYQGYRFSPLVDLNIYQAANPDLYAANLDNYGLFKDLVTSGVERGRRFSTVFDSNFYRNKYGDLAATGFNNLQLLEHFKAYGISEGRASSESFDVAYYLANNPDLIAAGFNNQQGLNHFISYGFKEGRVSSLSTSISPDSNRDDANLDKAFNFGILNSSRNFTDQSIGTNDRDDFYRFTLGQTSNFSLSLLGIQQGNSGKVELIFDGNGNGQIDEKELLYSSTATSNNPGSINQILGTGTYFIRVYAPEATDNTSYNLRVSATPAISTTPTDPGNNFSQALDIGAVTPRAKVNFSDFVGTTDRSDFYRFRLNELSNLSISLTGTGAEDFGYVELIYDINENGQYDVGEQLYFDNSSAFENGTINQTLGAGNYLIRVYTGDETDNTKYDLEVSTTSATVNTTTDPGSNLTQALDIGNLGGRSVTYQNFVGTTDREDWYRFSITDNRSLSLSLSGLSDSVYLEVIYDRNGNGEYDVGERFYNAIGSQFGSASASGFLQAGNYWVRVYTNDAVDNSLYTMSIAAQ